MNKSIFYLMILFITLSSHAQQARRLEVLFLGDNGHHKPIERVPSLMAALGPKGINITYTDNLADLTSENLKKYDAVLIFANHDELPADAEKAILDYVAAGHGFLPIHCASYCFRNSEAYVKLVGGQFWRHKMDSIKVEVVQPTHPVMADFKPFTVYDETYLHIQLKADNNVLAVRQIKDDQKTDRPDAKTEPYIWTRNHGKGKIFYTALGHDERTWLNEGFQDLIYKAILWSVNDDALSTFKQRNPQPLEYREANLPNYEQRPGKQMQQLPLSPEESMKHIQIPADFNLELFAAEPNVQHPIAMAWDERGRLFVLITKDYPNERKESGGSDFILLCEDTNADGKADKFTKWADGLSIPTGLVFANGGLIVSQAPDMLFLQDTNNDNKADVKKVLFSGFGTFDTHAGPSNLHYGFDNWIWGCVGYSGYKGKFAQGDTLKFWQAFFRFKLGLDNTPAAMEWITSTSNNTWGFGFNETGDVFGSTANNSHGWYAPIPNRFLNSANGIENGSRSTDTHRDMKPITQKVRQVDAFGGFTAAAGHNFYTARAFPKKYWNKIAFVAEPTGHVLHQNNLIKKGTDYADKEAFNLMAGADEWFSPVFAQTGPDGAVWVADWYSFIIQHNPTPAGFGNGTGNAYDTDLRDFTHGRIYRVSYKQAPAYQPISLSKTQPETLLNALKNNNLFWRITAQRLLVERGQKDVLPQLLELIKNTQPDEIGINGTAINALWTVAGLTQNEDAVLLEAIEAALQNSNADVRKNAVQLLENHPQAEALILKHKLLFDAEPLVVMNSLLVLSKTNIGAEAEKAFFEKLDKATEVDDRWLPDAFACVLTAQNGRLMKKVVQKVGVNTNQNAAPKAMAHDHSQMDHSKKTIETLADKLDLVITNINIEPANPAARERINVAVEVTNKSKVDLPAEVLVPLDVRFAGNGIINDQVSRNFKEGIKAGQSVLINKNLNGPWVGTLSFGSDFAGEYTLQVSLDPKNEIKESNEQNNAFSKKVTYSQPPSMQSFVLERAVRSYASVATADSLITILKTTQQADNQTKESITKAIAQGWNYKAKIVLVNKSNRDFALTLPHQSNANLEKLLKAWNIIESVKTTASKVIKIKAIRETMRYDVKEFTVKAGEDVELIFENPDAMQHNLVIVKPKNMEKVGTAADKMMLDEKGAEKNYVPVMPEVLFSTPLVNPDNSFTLRFKAPATAGLYPYVCTFPGHWRLMNGIMKVVK